MVTFAQAQERAEEWVNGDVPAYQHREVRVREFELGFVVWAEDRADGPTSDGGRQRLVIARDSGEATLWPGLPVGEVIRRYEEEYGAPEVGAAPVAPQSERVDLNQTSFLLSPPEWLQDAADKSGVPDRRSATGAVRAQPAGAGEPQDGPSGSSGGRDSYVGGDGGSASADGAPAGAHAGGGAVPAAPAVPGGAPQVPGSSGVGADWPAAGSGGTGQRPAAPGDPAGAGDATPWAGTDTNAGPGDGSVPLPATVFAPPLSGADDDDTPPPSVGADAPTALMSGGSQLPRTSVAPRVGQEGPEAPAPERPSAGDIADAATSKATPPPRAARGGGVAPPPPPGAPGVPGVRPGAAGPSGAAAPGAPAGGYVPTQLVSQLGPDGPQQPGSAAPRPPGPPGVPNGPQSPGTPPGGVHHAATVLAGPGQVPASGGPRPPGPPGVPNGPQPPAAPGPVAAAPQAGPPPAYGYPQQPPAGVPMVGPGYQAVLRYRAPDGSEQQLIRRSAPGTPHPEWQIFHELRGMNIPPDQVLELHTELESCELPGGYCARMIRETWPQARITSIAPYGKDHAGRRGGMQQLLTHQGELHQVADGPARPAPVRAPLPQVQPVPPVPPEALAQELVAAFGPQGICRFDQRAVSRQGVPDVVARTLVWAGLPADFGPFFWAQPAQPVVPTLAELAAQRQVQPASDAGSYLVVGTDFGRAICVQYGTAHIVAVPVEGGPGGQPVGPQFVNSGLPEFTRSLALLGRMWRLRFGLNPEQAGRWTVDFQAQLAALDPAALSSAESWWSVLLEQLWDGLL
ncbi:SUKH-4 family immunity protein [Streptomyces sp. NPDC059175]|uniref:SUKH-4 family immunity protein n=1 Tax=Streptomyces sp. NPDC059175 TaxID=3346757 RepID=UPI003698F930